MLILTLGRHQPTVLNVLLSYCPPSGLSRAKQVVARAAAAAAAAEERRRVGLEEIASLACLLEEASRYPKQS